jgi:hypothetical protein
LAVAALPAGSGSSSGVDSASTPGEASVPGSLYPVEAPVPVGAFAGDAPMGTTSMIPSPRSAGSEPSVQWTLGGPGFRDTGPHPTIDAPGPYSPVSESGAYRIANPELTGPVGRPIRDGYPIHDDHPGGYRPGYDGGHPGGGPGGPVAGYRNAHDSGHYRPAPGPYRTVSETGSHRPGDPGPYPGSDSGPHRLNSTGPRHSVRR